MCCTSFTDDRHSRNVCRHMKIIFRLSFPHDPPLGIGQVQTLLSSRPSPWDWSSPNPPFIATLSLGLVKSKSSFHHDPFLMNGQVLCSPFRQRPSPWEWLGPSYDPLRENSHRFLCLFLRIGHIIRRIETLYSVMVIESFQI